MVVGPRAHQFKNLTLRDLTGGDFLAGFSECLPRCVPGKGTTMPRKKKMTEKAIEANRTNGKVSKGPQTKEGKGKSAQNAIKIGFFSRQPYVAEADRKTYERLRLGIEQQLQPQTVLQRLQADAVIDAAWRCIQASQLDAQYLNQRLSAFGTGSVPAPAKLTITEWYASNPRGPCGRLST